MDFLQLAAKRQSDRAFSDRKVEREALMRCLEAARLAPSACNSQPWKFVVIDDPVQCAKAAEAVIANPMHINKFAATAPVLVAVVEEPALLTGMRQSNRWAQFDLGSATANFCLEAAEQGLGTCIMGAFDEDRMKELLHVPEQSRVFVMLAVGYPAGETRAKTRRDVESICSFNAYEAR